MNITDYNIHTKHVIDFHDADDEAYKVLEVTAYNYQGRALASNWKVTQINKKWWMFWIKDDGLCVRVRTGAAFEFPNEELLNMWLKEIPAYFMEPVAQTEQ